MIDSLLFELSKLRSVIIVALIFLSVLYFTFYIFTSEFKLSSFSVKIFSLFYDFDLSTCIGIAVMISRVLFIVLSSIFCKDIHFGYLICLMVMTVAIIFLLKDYKGAVTSLLSYFAIYIVNYLQSALLSFYNDVEHYWLYLAMVIALGIFISLYAIYQMLLTYNSLLSDEPKKKVNFKWQKLQRTQKQS